MPAEKGLADRLILISGQEDVFRRRSLAEFVANATQDGDFDFEEMIAGERPMMDWVASVSTTPFFSEKRTLVVRNLLRINDPADELGKIESLIKSLPETAQLILVVDEEPGDETKQQRLDRSRKFWETTVKKLGGKVVGTEIEPKNYKSILKKELAKSEFQLSESQYDLLLEMTGNSLTRAIEELEKLTLFAGTSKSVTDRDMHRVVVASREWRLYQLVDAALAGRTSEALKELKNLLGSSTKESDAAFSRIFPTLSRQIRSIWMARIILDAGGNAGRIPESVKGHLTDVVNFEKEPEWKVRKLFAAAQNVSLVMLTSALTTLSDADYKLKGGLDGYSAMDTLETMILRMGRSEKVR